MGYDSVEHAIEVETEIANRKKTRVDRILERGLTAAQLIEKLQDMPADAVPVFACDYGDHTHTQQIFPITEVEELNQSGFTLRESAYSQSGVALREVDEDDYDTEIENTPNAVLLR